MLFYLIAVIYFIIISVTGFVLPVIDKQKAEKHQWRIPEKELFAVSILGGSAAMYLSMIIFHHKTKHKRFMIGIPVIIALQLSAAAYIAYIVFERQG